MTDESQNIVASYVYDGFGKLVGQEGSEVVPYRFCGLWGYRNDWDARLLHVGMRYYEAEVGRFIQKDPQNSTLNLYVYSVNNPSNAVDIDGRVPLLLVVGVVIGIIGGTVLDYIENSELDKPWMPIVGGGLGYLLGGVAAAAIGGPGTYITLARIGPVAISVDHYIRGGGGINIRIPPGVVQDQLLRLGFDCHPIARGGKCLPHIDLIYKGQEVLHHWPWK